MAGADAGPDGRALPRPAAGGDPHLHAHAPEVLRGARPGRQARRRTSCVVANIEATDGGTAIVAGNARVLRARLKDARFFWDEDRKRTLESRLARLKGVFHAKLGTHVRAGGADRRARPRSSRRRSAPMPNRREQAARLAKADLATGMVGEFPELQGIMGGYYALGDGEPAAVADAIADHYKPQGPTDAVPTAPVSIAVALADKLDTLVGFFAIDEKPTGSRDPFACAAPRSASSASSSRTGLRIALRPLFADGRCAPTAA